MRSKKSIVFYVIGLAAVILALGLSAINLSEFYEINIKGNTDRYPWGMINDNPWYYSDSKTYSNFALISGLIFLTSGIISFVGLLKKKWTYVLISYIVIFSSILITLLGAALV